MPNRSHSFLGDLESDATQMRVGPFELRERIGDGSMGEVWRGYHSTQDVEVAFKMIVAEHAMKTSFQRAFRQEVRNASSLSHPFIVEVFDYGLIDVEAEHSSLGLFQSGSPYLVMEYARHGSLACAMDGPMPWETVQLILFALLDGLAHSHARGVIHRDVKPQNVLLGENKGQPQIKLTDFGLSYVMRGAQEVANWHKSAGTPEYMAPEQIRGAWRDYGAATDLYALGCLTHEMLTGRCPFGGRNMVQVARAHLDDPVPQLEAGEDTPPGMAEWLQVVLQKDSNQRFQSAADAAWALEQVGGRPDDGALLGVWQELVGDVESTVEAEERNNFDPKIFYGLESIFEEGREQGPVDGVADTVIPGPAGGAEGYFGPTRPVPRRGRKCREFFRPRRMVGTGRELFEMRRLPLIGRVGERDALWRRMVETIDQKQIGVTLLQGPAGVGKDRLAEWLTERATELGVAQVFSAFHESSNEIVDGIARAIEHEYSLYGQDRAGVMRFFRGLMTSLGASDPYEWRAISEIVYSGAPAEGEESAVNFENAKQRYLAVARFLRYLARRKPVVIWINDVQWAPEALRFLSTMIDEPDAQEAIYFVLTARDDLLAQDERCGDYVDQIAASERTEVINVGALPDEQLRRLVEESLFLDHEAVFEVVRRAAGNPLHAMELVRDWIDRDLLQPRADGFTLTEQVAQEPPGQWDEIWDGVIDRLSEGEEDGRQALELGAILGERFSRPRWEKVTQQIGVDLSADLLERALEAKYLKLTQNRIVFSQNILREALLASARSHGRWESHCRACAEVLDASEGTHYGDERIGFLLIEAGDVLAGARRLWNALEERKQRREYHQIVYLAERGQEVLKDGSHVDEQRLRGQFLLEAAHGWSLLSYKERSLERAQEAENLAERLGDEGTLRWAKFRRATVYLHLGEKRRAYEIFKRLKEETQSDDARFNCNLHIMLADIESGRGNLERAQRYRDFAMDEGQKLEDPIFLCFIQYHRLKNKLLAGEYNCGGEVEALIERSRKHRLTYGEAVSTNLRAELARRQGNLEAASIWYERAVEKYEFLDRDKSLLPRLNLVLVAVERQEWVRAGELARRILEQERRKKRPTLSMVALAAMLPMLMVRAEWSEASEVIDELKVGFQSYEMHLDYDLRLCLESARGLLGDQDRQKRLQEKLKALLEEFTPVDDKATDKDS